MGLLYRVNDAYWNVSYALVFWKAWQLPLKLEHETLWKCKKLNFDNPAAGEDKGMVFSSI